MANTSLTTLSLTPDPSFNWFFLLELIVSCILVLFFLLYFNRLFATVLSYGIRAYTWHYYRAYVDIHALQISLLGGRIFFKGIRYHGVNETIFVHGGFITWRYWRHSVRRTHVSNFNPSSEKADDGAQSREGDDDGDGCKDGDRGEQGGQKRADTLPCRITAKFYGFEWFIYNRTPAYDSILAGFMPSDPTATFTKPQYPGSSTLDPGLKEGSNNAPSENRSASDRGSSHGNFPARSGTGRETIGSQDAESSGQGMGESLSKLLQLLPLRLECDKGAIVVGNENTRSVLTTTFNGATGLVEACSAGPLDLYRQAFSFHLDHPVIQMRPNPDFKQNQLVAAKGLGSARPEPSGTKRKRDTIFNYHFQKRRVWHSIRDLIPYFQSSVESFHVSDKPANPSKLWGNVHSDARWTGLSRYIDETSHDDHEEWSSVEYGRFSTILDSRGMTISYFWDIPGCVKPHATAPSPSRQKSPLDINGGPPPDWGIDVKLEGGSINYGPWADRERVGLQNVFFPNSYRSSESAEPLTPGDLRKSTLFRLRIETSQDMTLRIPTREPSKDWQWKGRADAIRGSSKLKKQQQRRKSREGDKGHIGPDIRPFGWLSLRVSGDSTLNYTMDMVASGPKFRNQLDLDFRDSRMTSSVNHALLWQCPRQLLTCDLSVPLSWNDLRTWNFSVDNKSMELFLLRDHIFLLTDLVTDWASGPPQDYYTFVPFIYKLSLSFADLRLFVNVNDQNIISNPSDLDDNRLLLVKGKTLNSTVTIPLNKYRPDQNAVEFNIDVDDAAIDFLSPLWDTFHTFLSDKSAATLEHLSIGGSYNYYLSTSSELVDTLYLNLDGSSPRLYLYGFLIKCFMTVKENYFGEEMHFKTLEEFQELAYSKEQPELHNQVNPNRVSNDLDVIVHVNANDACALLPENIYNHVKCLRLTSPSLEIDLRFTNYYMDLEFSISPLKVSLESNQPDGQRVISDTQLFIDGISVYGHRLFGLAPAEPTYVCNWDFKVGRVIGEFSTAFLSCLGASLKSFDFSFDNEENGLPPLFPIALHDVTFLRANIDLIHVSILLDKVALVLSTGPLKTQFNDWTDARFSKRMSLNVPDISIAAVDYKFLGPFGGLLDTKLAPFALIQSTIKLRMAQRKNDIAEGRRLQQEHLKLHDERTQRTPWLLFDWEDIEPDFPLNKKDNLSPPTIPIPTMPEAVGKFSQGLTPPLARHNSDSRSYHSSESFIMHSDSSSVKNGRGRLAGRRFDTSRGLSQADVYPTKPRVAEDGRMFDALESIKIYGKDSSTSVPDSSNPWIMPNFSLYRIVLDTSRLPACGGTHGSPAESTFAEAKFDTYASPFEDDETTHTDFALELPTGVRGFCRPEFLFLVAELVGKLQPRHPISIIDSLQKDVVSDIVGYEKATKNPKQATSFAVRAPYVLISLVHSTDPLVSYEPGFHDEYSIRVTRLKTEIRSRYDQQTGNPVDKNTTVHAAAKSLVVSVRGGQADTYQDQAEFSCLFDDMNFWLVTIPFVKSKFQTRAFETITSTKSVEPLAFLVRRTTTMFDSLAYSFQHNSALERKRLRFLIYFLTQTAASTSDPVFLTRISYVLRVAPAHLRHHDSWKIISRIRNVYNCLSHDQQKDLISKCETDNILLPRNARSTVLSSFDQWRAWDLAHVEKSDVMRRVWDTFAPKEDNATPTAQFSIVVKSLRFSIDPGPKESGFVVEDLATAISAHPPKKQPSGVEIKQNNLITIQTYCSSTSLRLRWEILDIVEGVMKAMSSVTLESTVRTQTLGETQSEKSELQLTFGADLGSITLDGINVKLVLAGTGLRSSISQISNSRESPDGLSVLMSAEGCSSEISNISESLMLWKIADPHVYIARVSEQTGSDLTYDWRIVGSCTKLRYEMLEDPLNLAHTADRLIEDEVRYIHHLVKNLNSPTRQSPKVEPAKKSPNNRIHIATFLDDYRLSFCVLPSLKYVISGEVARTSIIPTRESKLEIDFDVKKNLHTFLSSEGSGWHRLSVLEIPPINGRVIANMAPVRTDVEVDMTIELIRVEASSVRSLLGSLTKPEVSHFMADLKENFKSLQQRLDQVLALDKTPKQTKDPPKDLGILYKASMSMAGIKVHALAPGLNGKDYSAELELSLGMMRMRLDNGLENGCPMQYPEFHVDTSNISLDLRKKEASRSRSYCSFAIDAKLQGTSTKLENGDLRRVYHLSSKRCDIELFSETAALVVDMAAHLQERIRTLDLSHEVERFKRLRKRGHTETKAKSPGIPEIRISDESGTQDLFDAMYSLDFNNIQIAWNMTTVVLPTSARKPDDLVFSIKRVELSNKKTNAAKLRIEDMQLQMVPFSSNREKRSLNSALMPELVFNVAYASIGQEVRLAFQAAGKSLDIRATSDFVMPASTIRDSIASASRIIRDANSSLMPKPSEEGTEEGMKQHSLFGNKRLRSVLVDVDFAGAIVSLQGRRSDDQHLTAGRKESRASDASYGHYIYGDEVATATLRAPGVALKVQFEDSSSAGSALNAELKVDPSTNVLHPSLVPLVKQMTSAVQHVMGGQQKPRRPSGAMMLQPQKLMQETPLDDEGRDTILGRCKLNVGILICKQEFSLSCQPIARVAATAGFESVYVTINTVQSDEYGRFLSLLMTFNSLQASVKHVYSSESTASFDVQSMVISVMNSKHIGSSKGISAVLRVSPMQVALNAKQVQDLLLFREIWFPSNEDIDVDRKFPPSSPETPPYIVQRYQQVASASAFPWNTAIAVERLEIHLDLGSTLGKAQFGITDLWMSSKKTSDREQTLCISLKSLGVEGKGRMSGLIELQTLKIHTSIHWPDDMLHSQTPLVQASIAFNQFQMKISFDYQPFIIGHITMFNFLMYNVRNVSANERLFSIIDGDKVQVFCTSLTASQTIALLQAWQRLVQDKKSAYERALEDAQRYMRRRTSSFASKSELPSETKTKKKDEKDEKAPISLQTGVVVSLNSVNLGVFPSSFYDNHVFKLEAHDAQAHFHVSLEEERIHSVLGLTLGELRVALSGITRPHPMEVQDLLVSEIATRVVESTGGTILKVPRLVASMETWQIPGDSKIDYIFHSSFEGKVDVGWNYSRISFIRDMWDSHSRALASRLGKPLPPSAVRITGGLKEGDDTKEQQEKITAVVNVPLSRYTYVALEPPVIETPQLRDMGEATPPLEWIGLQRDKLPNVTHQIIIVTLLEIAREVEDAYEKILGTS